MVSEHFVLEYTQFAGYFMTAFAHALQVCTMIGSLES